LDDKENTLLLLYRYSESELYRQFESRIIKHSCFIKKIDINYYQVMFLFNISKDFAEDVRKFKYGKYSELSEKLKKRILYFYGYSKDGNMYSILYKTDKRRKQLELEFQETLPTTIELFDKPDMNIEVYQK
jgi:hypothetical protein